MRRAALAALALALAACTTDNPAYTGCLYYLSGVWVDGCVDAATGAPDLGESDEGGEGTGDMRLVAWDLALAEDLAPAPPDLVELVDLARTPPDLSACAGQGEPPLNPPNCNPDDPHCGCCPGLGHVTIIGKGVFCCSPTMNCP